MSQETKAQTAKKNHDKLQSAQQRSQQSEGDGLHKIFAGLTTENSSREYIKNSDNHKQTNTRISKPLNKQANTVTDNFQKG